MTDDSIILEGANYKENLSSIITADSKIDALKKGVYGSTNVSLFIVSLCDFFNDRFEIGIEPPPYSTKRIKSGKNNKEHNWSDTVSYFKEELTKHYKNDPNADNKIKKLFYSLMYYITNLFPIIYKFDDRVSDL